jgi:hypothetical protein
LKATKAEIIRLAKLAKKDIARGHLGANARKAADILADYSNAAIDLLDLALEEVAQKRSDEPLFSSFVFLFGQALEALRLDIEGGYLTAADIAESVRQRLMAAGRSGNADPSAILFLVQTLGAAKIDLGKDLPGVVGRALEEGGEAEERDGGPADLAGVVADFVKQADGDAFALFSAVEETSGGVPDEFRAVMAATFLDSGEGVAMEAAVGWLLDPATAVRQAVAGVLEKAARDGNVTPTMLRRMIAMRNWLPEDSRPALDAAIAVARRKGLSPAQWEAVEVRELVITGVDGSGAIGVLGHCRDKGKHVLASLVLKHGVGVRDAWAHPGMTQNEIERILLEATTIDRFIIAPDFLRGAVGHFLALRQQTGSMLPFGLIRFLEAVGVSSVQPQLIEVASLLDAIGEGRAIGPDAFERLLADSIDLPEDYFFLDSWFEAGDKVDAVLTPNRGSRKKREALMMEKVLEPRRAWWAQAAAWAAYILFQSEDEERWQEFHAAATAMLQGRPLGEIGLMLRVAAQTVRAWEHRRNG